MSWTYGSGTNPRIDYVRLLIPDTNVLAPIFSDEEIEMGYQIQAAQFQSSMFFSPPQGRDLPQSPVSYLRVAALLLDSLANNNARLAGVIQLLDVKLDLSKASQGLRDGAKNYREMDDDAGAFLIVEQATTCWAISDRWWNQIQRQQGGAGL